MNNHLELREADRLRRAENRWLEQARERLRRPGRGPVPRTPASLPSPNEETDR